MSAVTPVTTVIFFILRMRKLSAQRGCDLLKVTQLKVAHLRIKASPAEPQGPCCFHRFPTAPSGSHVRSNWVRGSVPGDDAAASIRDGVQVSPLSPADTLQRTGLEEEGLKK